MLRYQPFKERIDCKTFNIGWWIFSVPVFLFLGLSVSTLITLIGYEIFFFFALAVMYFLYLASLIVRRYHDLNKSGWKGVLLLIPLIGPFFLIELVFNDGNKQENKYGKSEKFSFLKVFGISYHKSDSHKLERLDKKSILVKLKSGLIITFLILGIVFFLLQITGKKLVFEKRSFLGFQYVYTHDMADCVSFLYKNYGMISPRSDEQCAQEITYQHKLIWKMPKIR